MYCSDAPEHVRHYVEDSQSAMDNIAQSLAAVGRSLADLESCLDFACGYGRVTRSLAHVLGPQHVTAADVNRQAVRFCAHEFGVRPLTVHSETARSGFPARYDLVFVGSLLTHLPIAGCKTTLRALAGAVRPGGLLVFSTQGESCLTHLEWYGPEFVAAADRFRASVHAGGGHFMPYRGRRN
jgi:2-polyprenyl-3-methyl-5-hydroxy-6-metoxy-1,4-benzoquinol methylase